MEAKKTRILILGGGYGGLRVAISLQNNLKDTDNLEITLINKHAYHYQTTLLHKIAVQTLSVRKAKIFYRKILDLNKINFIKDKIININTKNKIITTNAGAYEYDILVVALGFKPEFFGIPGADKVFTLSSLNSAMKLGRHIEDKFKDYHINNNIDDLNVIVCGTGFTSIEFAAELAEELNDLCEIYGVDRNLPKITCIGRGKNILPVFSDKLKKILIEKLEKRGVKLLLGTSVDEIYDNSVKISDENGQRILKANTILWGAGVKGNDIVEKSDIPNHKGRVGVDEYLRVPNNPDIFVVGDCACCFIKDVMHAPTAQLAWQMGDYVGDYILKQIRGKTDMPAFKFNHRGTVCSMGHVDGVGVVYGREISGEVAAFVKNSIENRWLFSIGGLNMILKKGQFRFRTSS